MNINKWMVISMLCLSLGTAYACRVTVVNDTQNAVIIGDKTVNESKIVHPGMSTFVGSKDRQPIITVSMKEYGKGPYKRKFEVKMVACVHKVKKANLNVSDIQNNTYNKEIFLATPFTNKHTTVLTTPEDVMMHK